MTGSTRRENPEPDKSSRASEPLHPLPPGAESSTDTGLPGLRSWAAVYTVVIGIFIVWVVLMTVFKLTYS